MTEDKEEDKGTDGVQLKTDEEKPKTMIEQAQIENDRMEANLKKRDEQLAREEEIQAKRMLGGITEAGSPSIEKKEETPKEYRMRINKEMALGKTEFGD